MKKKDYTKNLPRCLSLAVNTACIDIQVICASIKFIEYQFLPISATNILHVLSILFKTYSTHSQLSTFHGGIYLQHSRLTIAPAPPPPSHHRHRRRMRRLDIWHLQIHKQIHFDMNLSVAYLLLWHRMPEKLKRNTCISILQCTLSSTCRHYDVADAVAFL